MSILIDQGTTTPIATVNIAGDEYSVVICVDGSANEVGTPSNPWNIDVVSALPAGTNNIGDVDVVSSALPTGASTAAKQPALGTAGTASSDVITVQGIASMTPLSTTVSSSALPTGAATETTLSALNTKVTAVNTGAVVISSSALPTGAATEATLSSLNGKVTAVNTGAVVISSSALPTGAATETTLSALNTKVTACNTGAVTISAALPAGTNAIGKLAANSGVDIGDVDVTSLPALAAGTNLIGRVSGSDETSTVYNGTTALTPKFAVVSASTSGNNTLVAAVTSKKIRVLSGVFMSAGTVNATFQSGAGGTGLTGAMPLIANIGFTLPYSPVGHFESASGVLLNLSLSAAIAVTGVITYVEV